MSREEDFKEDRCELSELEAELAALTPRAEKLNRDRLMFLAGQASVESRSSQTAVGRIANLPHSRQVGKLPHVPWVWPAAFASMTCVAAILLAALVIRPAPQATERIVERIVTVPVAPQESTAASAPNLVAAEAVDEARAMAPALPDWLAWWHFTHPAANTEHEPSYPELRNQVLHGLKPWKAPVSESTAYGRSDEEPAGAGEMLNHWLEQEGIPNGVRRAATPSLRNSSGARS
jgi:hypothetical protein